MSIETPRHHDTSTPMRVRVVIADSDPVARRALGDRLRAAPGIVVAACARDGVEAIELACHYRPEVLLLATALDRVDPITVLHRVLHRAPSVRAVMLAVEDDADAELQALRAGASGFLVKDLDPAAMARAVRGVSRGEAAVSRRAAMRIVRLVQAAPSNGIGIRPIRSSLTNREWEILDMLAGGLGFGDLATELVVTSETVQSHLKSIRRKLGVKTRGEMIAAAQQLQSACAA